MNKNQKELERIIFNAVMDELTKETREYLAKYILDRGYIKLEEWNKPKPESSTQDKDGNPIWEKPLYLRERR